MICVVPSCFLQRHTAKKSGLDPLCLVRPARARTTTTSRAAKMQTWSLHCRPIQLAVSPDDAYKPRKTGLCKNQVTLKLPCTSIFGVDGRKISLVIYSAVAFFSTSGGDFSAVWRMKFRIFIAKNLFPVYIIVGSCIKNRDLSKGR